MSPTGPPQTFVTRHYVGFPLRHEDVIVEHSENIPGETKKIDMFVT